MKSKWTNEELNFIKNNYQKLSDNEIAEVLICRSKDAVATKRKKMGLTRTNRKYSFQDVLNEFAKTEYELLSTEEDYVDAATNSLKYLCNKHKDKGIQTISLGHLQSGRGCYYCGREITEQAHLIDLSDDKECRLLCENKGFTYVDTIREDGIIYIQYICNKHPEAGMQKMRKGNMKRDNIQGCPYCFDTKKFKFSKGEKRIEEVLDSLDILYLPQYTFADCRDTNVLPFDYYLLELNIAIEYDGEHHYYPVTFNGISKEQAEINHKRTIKHDKIKNQYCKEHNIQLIRIPYFEYNNIEKILQGELDINNQQLT